MVNLTGGGLLSPKNGKKMAATMEIDEQGGIAVGDCGGAGGGGMYGSITGHEAVLVVLVRLL